MKVVEFEPGRSFTLETTVIPLSRFRFTCRVEPAGERGVGRAEALPSTADRGDVPPQIKTRVSQSVKVVGPMGWLFDPMMGDQIANDFDTVLDGLVKKAEGTG
jgi:hypothetical protein